MFRKLKQKISEEQTTSAPRSPDARAPSFPQGSSASSPSIPRSRTSSLTEQNDESTLTSSRELLAGIISEPAFLSEYTVFALDPTKQPKPKSESVIIYKQNTNSCEYESSSPQMSDVQSFAQKLQLRVPSMESLFRSPLKESLFLSSSKESLVRTSSKDSLNKLDFDSPFPTFDPPSDAESETEELPGNVDSLPKEQLLHRLRRMERSLGTYRGKYSELVTAYQAIQREKKKLQGILSQSQDKALRRIGELREELQMDQQAKKHLQEEFDASLEEKDQLISVLQTQVSLLKQRLHNGQISIELPNPNILTQSQVQSPVNIENTVQPESPGGHGDPDKTMETLTQRVKRQENLLQRCKETIRSLKERSAQLISEKEALQEQLDERLQELEKIKDLHMAEKTKLITQLRDAKNLIEQLEQDKGMVIAETKRQMHETLEMKEEEIAQLRTHIKQVVLQSEELKEQKEKSEKSAFEELEKALSTAQRAEEARKKLQAEMDEKIKAIEKANEEERVSLQQELTRVKQEVVSIMKKSSEDRFIELEKLHKNELTSKDKMLNDRLQSQEQQFQEEMKTAIEKIQNDHLQAMKEKVQQESLALEELELQKKAIQLECNRKLEDAQQEIETFKTRILELESSIIKCPQNEKKQLEELTGQIESEKNKHNKEIAAMTEEYRKELEAVKQIWKEKVDILTQQQQSEMEKLKKHGEEMTKQLKEKETIFHAHIEEMNEKTLERLDVKQTELEALSSELSDALKSHKNLEQYLSKLKDDADKAKLEFEAKFEQQKNNHKEQIESMFKDHEVVEKTFKEEINQLKQLLEAKEKCQEESEEQLKKMKESLVQTELKCKKMSTELEISCQIRDDNEDKLENFKENLADIKTEKSNLEKLLIKTETQLNEVKVELDSQISQVHDLKCKLAEEKKENTQKTSSLTESYESQLRNLREEVSQVKSNFTDKENEIEQMKGLLHQQIEEHKQQLSAKEKEISALRDEHEIKLKHQETQTEKAKEKAKKMQEMFKQKLSEQEAKLKKEIENKQLELIQKEEQFNLKMLEMAHASSAGINDTVSKLEMNQKEQLESMAETHQRQLDEVVYLWEKKLNLQAEKLQEKHEIELQEKEQEIGDLKEKLATFIAEREGNNAEIMWLKDENTRKDKSINEFQEQLQRTLAQVTILTEKEIDLTKQVEKLENDLSLSLKEKIAKQEELKEIKRIKEKEKFEISELAEKLKKSDTEVQALKLSYFKEHENYEKKIEEKNVEIQQKKSEFEKLKEDTITHLTNYQKKAEALLQVKTSELIEKFSEKMSSVIVKIAHCQQQVTKIKEGILIKICKIPDIEIQLKQITESHEHLTSCFHESKKLLQEKENVIMSLKEDMEKLHTEKELLQQEGGHQQQTATELKKELSEHSNIITSMREELNEKKMVITDLSKLVSELNLRLGSSLSEKDAPELLNKQCKGNHLQLQNEMQVLSSKIEMLCQEKAAALEQVGHWKNKMSEWKKKAQLRFIQNQDTIKELQGKIESSNNQASEKEGELNRMKEEHDKQTKHLEHVKGLLEQKQTRREKQESDLVAELKIHTARIAELEEHIARKTAENDSLTEECRKYHERDSEQKEVAQQLQQAQVAVVEKDNKLKVMEQTLLILEEKIQNMEIDLKEKSKEFEETKATLMKAKKEELQALQERHISETASKIADLKKKAEQKCASIKKQLTSQMEEKEQQYRQDMEKQLEQKLQEKENKIISLEEKIKSVNSEAKKELMQKEETIPFCVEQDKVHALEHMQQVYELKIDVLKKDLLVKENQLKLYSEEAKTANVLKLGAQEPKEKLKMREEDQNKIEKLQQELEEQIKKQALLLEEHTKYDSELTNIRVELKNKEEEQQNMENVIKDLEKNLQEKEKEGQSLQQKIHHFGEDFMKEREQHRTEMENTISGYDEKLHRFQQQLDERNIFIKSLEETIEEKTRSVLDLQKLLDEVQTQEKNVQAKLKQTEQEKQEQHRDLIKLQKDLRTLRKEHQQELEIMKKESVEEMEQKLKYEQEDTELKHNSTLKQLMREFNTQLAQKDQELEMAVKETISKAQEVESELIESHHTEIAQLHKKILEKEDDLQRTVKKYEEILEAREEEMTRKVNELEEQLERLQEDYKQRLADEESWNCDEITIAELQAQLAQKTTLVNDSKLKEQEFKEQIHTLQDRLKNYEKSVYVTTVETPYRDGNLCHSDVSLFGEPTEFEYLRKVLFEYMMGRETKTMAKVITTVLKFPPDQTQKILDREDSRTLVGIDQRFGSKNFGQYWETIPVQSWLRPST